MTSPQVKHKSSKLRDFSSPKPSKNNQNHILERYLKNINSFGGTPHPKQQQQSEQPEKPQKSTRKVRRARGHSREASEGMKQFAFSFGKLLSIPFFNNSKDSLASFKFLKRKEIVDLPSPPSSQGSYTDIQISVSMYSPSRIEQRIVSTLSEVSSRWLTRLIV